MFRLCGLIADYAPPISPGIGAIGPTGGLVLIPCPNVPSAPASTLRRSPMPTRPPVITGCLSYGPGAGRALAALALAVQDVRGRYFDCAPDHLQDGELSRLRRHGCDPAPPTHPGFPARCADSTRPPREGVAVRVTWGRSRETAGEEPRQRTGPRQWRRWRAPWRGSPGESGYGYADA